MQNNQASQQDSLSRRFLEPTLRFWRESQALVSMGQVGYGYKEVGYSLSLQSGAAA